MLLNKANVFLTLCVCACGVVTHLLHFVAVVRTDVMWNMGNTSNTAQVS